MARAAHLRLQDLRSVFRLIGECRELGADARAWRQHMLDGLRELTNAQVALYLHILDLNTEVESIGEPLDSGFLDDSHRALWGHYQRERAHRDDPFHQRYYRRFTGALRTRSLESVVDMREWLASRHYNEYIRACGLDDRITSSVHIPGSSPAVTQVVVLHRAAADGNYAPRATPLVRLFHQELTPLIGCQLAMPGKDAAPLPAQLERVLACLLQGDSEKQAACRLGISRHTVNRHVQRLYRRFGVHSRGGLMHRCRGRTASLLHEGVEGEARGITAARERSETE